MTSDAAAPLAPSHLRCEYLTDPLGIEVTEPRLSWRVNDPRRGAVQSAYRVLVASSPAKLAADEGDLWDSGRVESETSIQIGYAGQTLASRMRCHWKVRTWDAAGQPSPWSEPALWTMGLLEGSEWRASWIGYDGPPPEKPDPEVGVEGGKWVWYPEPGRDPRVSVPWGQRPFRGRFAVPTDARITRARMAITCDDQFTLYVNGTKAGESDGHRNAWRRPQLVDVTGLVRPGENVLAVIGRTIGEGPAGLTGRLVIETDAATVTVLVDESWKTLHHEPRGWTAPEFDDSAWPAVQLVGEVGIEPWGVPSDPPLRLVCAYLRREFPVEKPVRRATVYATALGSYELLLNGRPVTEDLLTPGWTDFAKRIYYRTYDVTERLSHGPNAIAATVAPGWYGLQGRYGEQFRLLAQLEIEYADGQTETIVTDPSWQASLGPVVSSDQYHGETYDARQEMPGWAAAGLDAAAWSPVAVTEGVAAALEAYPGVPVRRTGELKAVGVAEIEPGRFIFDLGQNFTGWARLKVAGPAGTTVVLRFAEVLEPDGRIHTANLRSAKCTDTYVLKGGGDEVWEPRFTFHGFRYVEVTGYPGRPPADAITGIAVNSDTPVTGAFECSNSLLNRFWRNTTWTQRGNFLEVPTDCPQRDERLGWTGDAQIYIPTAAYNMDVAAFFTKWFVDLEDAQRPNGAFTDVAPFVVAGWGVAAWGDAGVVCPWVIHRMYGDTRVLRRHYQAMTRWIDFMKAHSDGLLRPAYGYGDWVPAGPDTPKDVIATAYFAYSTRLVSKIAKAIGKDDDAAAYEDLFQQIRAAFNKAYVADDGRIQGDTQTGYAVALHFDLLPEEKRAVAADYLAQDIERLGDHLAVGFVGAGSLLPALASVGRHDVAWRLIEQETYPSWLYPVVHGATSIWERWNGWTEEKGLHDPGMNSFAHYAYGSAGAWLFSVATGIAPETPGFKRIVIRPQPGGKVTDVKASYYSAHGPIASAWRLEEGDLALDVTVPANTTATVFVPAKDPADVTEGGKAADRADGVTFLRTEDGAAVYEVGAGTYAFASRGWSA